MYRLRYHNPDEGQSVITMDPAIRTILTRSSDVYGNILGKPMPVRVPFPYMHFSFNYTMVPGGYRYGGFFKQALYSFFTREPLGVMRGIFWRSQQKFYNPTDYRPEPEHSGLVCTDHSYDGTVYRTPEDLMGTILNLWWNSAHDVYWPCKGRGVDISKAWGRMTLPQALNYNWIKLSCERALPANVKYIDEPIKLVAKKDPRLSDIR